MQSWPHALSQLLGNMHAGMQDTEQSIDAAVVKTWLQANMPELEPALAVEAYPNSKQQQVRQSILVIMIQLPKLVCRTQSRALMPQ